MLQFAWCTLLPVAWCARNLVRRFCLPGALCCMLLLCRCVAWYIFAYSLTLRFTLHDQAAHSALQNDAFEHCSCLFQSLFTANPLSHSQTLAARACTNRCSPHIPCCIHRPHQAGSYPKRGSNCICLVAFINHIQPVFQSVVRPYHMMRKLAALDQFNRCSA